MPLYEYECFVCKNRFERIQKTTAEPVKICPGCGGAVRRLLGVPALQFKGSGWYVTDYGKGSSTAAGHAKDASSEESTSESTSSSTPPKTESSSTSKASKESKTSS
jgi:putative FmdB family regulatory protein